MMKDLLKLSAECMAQLNALGIDCGKVTFTVNTRAKKRWGQCRVVGAGSYEISISERLLHDDVDDMAAKNTIMHELAHASDGCRSGHRGEWVRIVSEIMRAYPEYNIKRCTSLAEKGFDEAEEPVRRLEYTYFYRCLGCGVEVKYKRASKFTRDPNSYYCRVYGGRFVTQAEYDILSPVQKTAMNRALAAAAPRKISKSERDKILRMK